ncbi:MULTISPECIES: hypothetical protein [unclassified Schlesneria]|uniref:hypothetical protein n=1 Tax=Schlesneria TaxID=656899 RepID=UPI002F069AFA
MFDLNPGSMLSVVAAVDTATLTVREFDWPTTSLGWLLLIGGSVLFVAWSIWLYLRDTADLRWYWRVWLILLRVGILASLLVIALNPSDRTQKESYRPSRVGILVDTSLSMRHPAGNPSERESPGTATGPSRADEVKRLLVTSNLVETLRKQHEVSIFTYDSGLVGPHRVFPRTGGESTSNGDVVPESESPLDWEELLRPRGLESRLGESLDELIRLSAGKTLSGLVVMTDGASNAGIDPATTHDRAIATKSRLIAVGTGTTEQPVNLAVSEIASPTDVQMGDPFEITAFIQGNGLAGREVDVELLMKSGADVEPVAVERKKATLLEDSLPVEVKFSRNPTEAGRVTYVVRASTPNRIAEFNSQDNELSFTVNTFDRPTRVLLVAGGPMRDYQFVRNLLFRHKSFDVDVYLQSGGPGTSQESNRLLTAFPAAKEELYEYDVVMAFDPDWKSIPAESFKTLSDWVSLEGGGLILVAGDVNTPTLAGMSDAAASGAAGDEAYRPLLELYPVFLSSYFTSSRFDQDSTQPWPVKFSKEGQSLGFLQLTDDPVTSAARWKAFPGIYRCYPTNGHKAGAKVYANFSDPRAAGEPPVLMAGQPLSKGFVFYLGSAEMWRLRSVSEDDYDRFWIKTIREVGQGRSKRGTKRGLLMPDSRKLLIGQTLRVRARVLDAKYDPLEAETVTLDIHDPAGKPLTPPRQLRRDPSSPGVFTGDFRVSLPGTYKLDLLLPDSRERVTDEIVVALPKLEDENIRQNVRLLTDLVRDTGGKYLTVDEAIVELPGLLPDRGEQFYVPERLRTLWDRQWVMYLLVSILSIEWLTRKILKLA